MSVLDASEELIQLAKDLDSFDLDLDGESFLLDDPQDWSTSDDAAKPPCQDEIEDGTTSSTDNAAFSAARPKPRRVRKNYDGPFGKRTYFDLTTGDVAMGRGGSTNRHKGNQRFHRAKTLLQPAYLRTSQVNRTAIAQQLVDTVHSWGGHFLKKDPKGWYEVHNHTARTKCSQALRETLTNEQRAIKRQHYRNREKQDIDVSHTV